MHFSLNSYIKYCLGYLSLTKTTGFGRGRALDIELPKDYFSLTNLVNGDTDGSLKEVIDLEVYYNNDPKNLAEDIIDQYQNEKAFALQINEIYSKAKNDTYTKEVILRFGKFNFDVFEMPIVDTDTDIENDVEENSVVETEEDKLVTKEFYLFSLPVRIEKDTDTSNIDRYSIIPVDSDVRLNLPPLYEIFRTYKKEDLVYEFLNEYVKLESEGEYSIPISSEQVFLNLWHILKSKLKLTDAVFINPSHKYLTSHTSLAVYQKTI